MSSGVSGTRRGRSGSAETVSGNTPYSLRNYSEWKEDTDYRNGLPFALKQQLKADGWEMDAKALAAESEDGSEIEFLDVQTGERFTYKKEIVTEVNEVSGNEYIVSRYTMTDGYSSEMPHLAQAYGEDGLLNITNGIVAREKKKK